MSPVTGDGEVRLAGEIVSTAAAGTHVSAPCGAVPRRAGDVEHETNGVSVRWVACEAFELRCVSAERDLRAARLASASSWASSVGSLPHRRGGAVHGTAATVCS